MNYYCYIGCSILTAEVCQIIPEIDALVDLRFVPAGFHEQPGVMQEVIQAEINRVEQWNEIRKKSPGSFKTYDALLLGLGLCNKAVIGLAARSLPLVVPRAHDCLTLLLGSRERYEAHVRENPGNYWYSCGWIERMLQPGPEREARLKAEYLERYGAENAAYLMEQEFAWQKQYRQATFVGSDPQRDQKYRHFTRECAHYLGWRYAELKGDLSLLTDFLNGNWDPERFLIVNPGEAVAASFDETILDSVRRCD